MNKLVTVLGIVVILLSIVCGMLCYQIGDVQTQNSTFQNQVSQLENQINELCIALLKGEDWKTIRTILKGIEGEPESIRRGILGYLNSGLMNGWTDKYKRNVFQLMECFEYNFYDTGAVGLSMACYRGSMV